MPRNSHWADITNIVSIDFSQLLQLKSDWSSVLEFFLQQELRHNQETAGRRHFGMFVKQVEANRTYDVVRNNLLSVNQNLAIDSDFMQYLDMAKKVGSELRLSGNNVKASAAAIKTLNHIARAQKHIQETVSKFDVRLLAANRQFPLFSDGQFGLYLTLVLTLMFALFSWAVLWAYCVRFKPLAKRRSKRKRRMFNSANVGWELTVTCGDSRIWSLSNVRIVLVNTACFRHNREIQEEKATGWLGCHY